MIQYDDDLDLSVDHPSEELGLVGELDLTGQRDHVALVIIIVMLNQHC